MKKYLSNTLALLLTVLLLLSSCGVVDKKSVNTDSQHKSSVVDENVENVGQTGMHLVSDVSDLMQQTPPENRALILLSGYYKDGDGGGGMFYWDVSRTDQPNGGTVIAPSGYEDKTGRYIRVYDPTHVNVKWFGARGNGSTDDTKAIQAAIDVLPADGGEVILPGGQYAITDTLQIGDGDGTTPSTKNGIKLVGTGGQFGYATNISTSLVCRAKIDVMISVNGPIYDCAIEGIRVNANNNGNSGMVLTAMSGSRIERVQVICHNKTGIILQGGAGEFGDSHDNIFRQFGCTTNVNDTVMIAIGSNTDTDGVVRNCVFTDCRFDTGQMENSISVHMMRAEELTFQRCHFNVYKFDTSLGLLLDGRNNDGYPKQNSYYDCSITRLSVEESDNGQIGYNFLFGNGACDHETHDAHPKLFGFSCKGSIIGVNEDVA